MRGYRYIENYSIPNSGDSISAVCVRNVDYSPLSVEEDISRKNRHQLENYWVRNWTEETSGIRVGNELVIRTFKKKEGESSIGYPNGEAWLLERMVNGIASYRVLFPDTSSTDSYTSLQEANEGSFLRCLLRELLKKLERKIDERLKKQKELYEAYMSRTEGEAAPAPIGFTEVKDIPPELLDITEMSMGNRLTHPQDTEGLARVPAFETQQTNKKIAISENPAIQRKMSVPTNTDGYT